MSREPTVRAAASTELTAANSDKSPHDSAHAEYVFADDLTTATLPSVATAARTAARHGIPARGG